MRIYRVSVIGNPVTAPPPPPSAQPPPPSSVPQMTSGPDRYQLTDMMDGSWVGWGGRGRRRRSEERADDCAGSLSLQLLAARITLYPAAEIELIGRECKKPPWLRPSFPPSCCPQSAATSGSPAGCLRPLV